MTKQKEIDFDYFVFADQIIKICQNSINEKSIRQAWRVMVKDKIDAHFGTEIPWELCDGAMNIVWDAYKERALAIQKSKLDEESNNA